MIDNDTAKELAGKLHKANSRVVTARRAVVVAPESAIDNLDAASALIKEVIETLMDQPGQTDYYGNPTARGDGVAWRISIG